MHHSIEYQIKKYLLLALLALYVPVTNADILPGVSYLTDNVVRESAIAFVNTTTSPGIEGATLTVDDGNRQSEQWIETKFGQNKGRLLSQPPCLFGDPKDRSNKPCEISNMHVILRPKRKTNMCIISMR